LEDLAEKIGNHVGMDLADLRFALGRVVSSGLLDRVTSYEENESIVLVDPDEGGLGFYQVTPGFRKLMSFMEQEG
jgi:hypothetical protein